ncbi:MAG: hypothetical protein ACE5JM_09930, partial [Armatimonadota bacterium]
LRAGGPLVDDGTPVFLRAAMYYQPHAFHQYFWTELDESLLEPDLESMRQHGINTVVLEVDWGAFMPSVDVGAETFTWNADTEQKLRRILALAYDKEMYAMLWFSWSRAPEGVGAKPYEAGPDLGGREHPPFNGYLLPSYPAIAINDAFAWKACLTFHERIAKLTADFEHVLFDPLDWQHLNMSYWAWADAQNLAAWRRHLMAIDPQLHDWDHSWREENASWEHVLLPVDSHLLTTAARLPDSPYAGLPALIYNAAKWYDFNEWHDAVFIQVARQIIDALERGNPRAPIGQRIDRWRYGQWRPRTWAPWHPEGETGPIAGRFYCISYYPRTREDAEQAEAKLAETLRKVRELDKHGYPIMLWETGIDSARLHEGADAEARETAQRDHLDVVAATAELRRLLGFGWWVWRDYHMSEAAQHYGLVGIDGAEKKAAELLKWAYGPEAEPEEETDKKKPKKRQPRRRGRE